MRDSLWGLASESLRLVSPLLMNFGVSAQMAFFVAGDGDGGRFADREGLVLIWRPWNHV